MAIDAAQAREVGRRLGQRMFQGGRKRTADLSLTDLANAVAALDAAMEHTRNDIAPGTTIRQHLIASLPEPFKSRATALDKVMALLLWAEHEAGK